MVDYVPRSAWNARSPKAGPGDLTPSRVEGVVIHWPGTGDDKPIHSQAAVASALRGWQDYHMDGHGWSDIAYQVAVDQSGRAWTLRGLRTQSGANGDNDVNERYGAILLILVNGEEPSEAMKATVREVVLDFRGIYGDDAAAIKPHSAVRPEPTDCPGPAARAAIVRGDFEPWAHQNPTEEDPLSGITADQIGAAVGVALAPKLDALAAKLDATEQRYTVADNAHEDQAAAWIATGQAYAAFRIQQAAVDGKVSADELVAIKNDVWAFLRPLWGK